MAEAEVSEASPPVETEAQTMPDDGSGLPLNVSDASADDAGSGAESVVVADDGGNRATFDALALHKRAIVIDTHNDVTLRLTDEEDFDFGQRMADGHSDLVRMREGGLDAQFMSVWVNPRYFSKKQAWDRAMAMFDAIEGQLARYPDKAVSARTVSDIRAAQAQGKIALLIGVEGAHALGDFGSDEEGLARLRKLHDRGAGYLTLTWMNTNRLGGSSGDYGRTKGLTKLGRRAVKLMNDLGMIVDVSHVSDPTFYEAIEASRLPVLASHSGVRAIHDHYRNLDDEMLRAIAKNGGAACIVFYPGFLDSRWAAAWRRARRNGTTDQVEPLPMSKLADHIDHAVKVAGVDHVCLGSDFDGIGAPPGGLEDVSKLPALTAELARRGYSAEALEKILGGNVLRVMEANEGGAITPRLPSTPLP